MTDKIEPRDARTVKVQAQMLKKGDWLVGSGRLVTHAPSKGVHTPKGKVDVGIDGYQRTWGAYTQITVRRAGATRKEHEQPRPDPGR